MEAKRYEDPREKELNKYRKTIYLYKRHGYKGKIKYIRLFDTIFDCAEYLNTTPEVIKEVLEHRPYFKSSKGKFIISRKWLRWINGYTYF